MLKLLEFCLLLFFACILALLAPTFSSLIFIFRCLIIELWLVFGVWYFCCDSVVIVFLVCVAFGCTLSCLVVCQ